MHMTLMHIMCISSLIRTILPLKMMEKGCRMLREIFRNILTSPPYHEVTKKILIRRLIERKWGGKELASWQRFPYPRMYLLKR